MPADALARFITTVEEHYRQENPPPLLLSTFGQRNRALLVELKENFGSLMAAVRVAGEDRIRFIDTTSGREAVAPAAIAANLQREIQEATASQRQAANFFDTLPSSVQLAFCVRTKAGEHVTIDVVRPFRFAKVTSPDLIRSTQRIIADKFRRPGLSLRTASVAERQALWRHFATWSEEAGVDPATFRQGGATTALARLIAAQPADVVPRLVIPGDIAQLLMKHS